MLDRVSHDCWREPLRLDVQLLQIAIGNIMTTPIRHSIELDAM
jgi:hypothetical protein